MPNSTLPYGLPFLSATQLLDKLNIVNPIAINIGASDGISDDPLAEVFLNGASGIMIEPNTTKFSLLCNHFPSIRIHKVNAFARPNTILDLLGSFEVGQPNIISVDIDSYDHYILREVRKLVPDILMVEINESMPPDVYFHLKYDPDYVWSSGRFFGCSLACANWIVKDRYSLVQVDWNIAFFVRKDYNCPSVYTRQAWFEGYWDRPGRAKAYWWDNPVDISRLPVDEQITSINASLRDFAGRYSIGSSPMPLD